ncbi:histone deacetylase, partial [bacterium CPR1]|nr:histone deacetylase [bacterium CPR1]
MKVFYTEKQSVSENASFSPSAGKPSKLVEQWLRRYPIELVEPEPVTAEELSCAHDPDYVREVLACRRANGFSNTSREVVTSLPYTTGSLVSAARHVVENAGAACSPTSGFHHAC